MSPDPSATLRETDDIQTSDLWSLVAFSSSSVSTTEGRGTGDVSERVRVKSVYISVQSVVN